MRVTLVNMPWAAIDFPSLAIGLLKSSLARTNPEIQVSTVYANLEFVDWITGQADFAARDYSHYSLRSYFQGHGDWVFSSALYDDAKWRNDEFQKLYGEPLGPEKLARALRLHELAPQFIDHVGGMILGTRPDVVGFTSTFQQNVASLAAARHLKRQAPQVLNVFGGANCDAEQGAAMHRNFPFVDFVVRGEGELSFPQLLSALGESGDTSAIAGLCRRAASGASEVNPMSRRPLAPAEIPTPNYDGFFERLTDSAARDWVEPKLIVEGSRGCWWGEKHHCTFCGLNGSFMEFRGKSPERFEREIMGLVERHKVLDVFATDNIMDMAYLNSLLPRIIESGYDLRMQYEIKSNLRAEQVDTLVRAGVVSAQPGIENLNSHVLKLMDKGVSGYQNVRLLRDAETAGLTVAWNYLYGFPGETDEDYETIIEQIPALHHLYPPDGSTRIALERFSPYYNRPDLGFPERWPDKQYKLIYDLPEAELMDLAYLFNTPDQGIGNDLGKRLSEVVEQWQESYGGSRLAHCDLGQSIVLTNRRSHFQWASLELTEPLELAVFRLLDQPRTQVSVVRALAAEPDPHGTEERVAELLRQWRDLGLVFEESGRYIQISTAANNQDVMHIRELEDRVASAPVPAIFTGRSEDLETAQA